ncbi:uncharacterized protein CXQ87_000093 [Candidozyma duobushaemuli]|uniref:Sec20 C-terminal domain-containing protein n=2 Tax=Candidozyma TaxID=3303203 RepID=A0ABX8I0J7_9ASCO|nr:uncharacterized protein CXQ87_000093 [[Candida] duobushaemulonis]PVH17211.1 hypothetical protein CXQ87_000093 [[Candida] duobushaemulonis]QWU85870.1 hypothetical protein CA3LBN_000088 [[Candida] haemuloni]
MSNLDFRPQLTELSRLRDEVFENIEDIKNLKDDEIDSIETRRNTLTKRAHYSINQMNDLLSVLEILISQQAPRKADQDLLWEQFALHKSTVRNLKERLRDSQTTAYEEESKRVHGQIIDEYVKKWSNQNEDSREQLFAGRSTAQEESGDKPIEEQVLTQNKNITNSLRLTKQLMTMSVMQTELNTETLEQQTRDLHKVNDKLVDLDALLNKSRQIVKFIEKQDKRDNRRIYFSIGFLLLCLAWVIWHRILKLPVKMLTWSLLKVLGVVSWFTTKKELTDPISSYSTLRHEQEVYSSPLESNVLSSETPTLVEDVIDATSSEIIENFVSAEPIIKGSLSEEEVAGESFENIESPSIDVEIGTTTISTEEVAPYIETESLEEPSSDETSEIIEPINSKTEEKKSDQDKIDELEESYNEAQEKVDSTAENNPDFDRDIQKEDQEPENVQTTASVDIQPEEVIEEEPITVDEPYREEPLSSIISEALDDDSETPTFHEWTPPNAHDEL